MCNYFDLEMPWNEDFFNLKSNPRKISDKKILITLNLIKYKWDFFQA